jgi:hypothetical protein
MGKNIPGFDECSMAQVSCYFSGLVITWAADGPGPDRVTVGGGIIPFSLFVLSASRHNRYTGTLLKA